MGEPRRVTCSVPDCDRPGHYKPEPKPSESAESLAADCLLTNDDPHFNDSWYLPVDLKERIVTAISFASASARNAGLEEALKAGDDWRFDTGDPTYDEGRRSGVSEYQGVIRKLITPSVGIDAGEDDA